MQETSKLGPGIWRRPWKISPLYYDALYSLRGPTRRQGSFDQAILLFQRLLRYYPQMVDGWFQLGLSYAGSGQYGKATDAYRLALERSPDFGQCHCALALALRETRQSQESLAEAQHCLALLPGYAGAWNLIGNAQTDLGDFGAALEAYQKAVEIEPSYINAHFNLGLALSSLNRNDEAEAAIKETLRLKPDMVDSWVILGNVQMRLDEKRQALQSFGTALKLSPEDADAEWGVARALRSLGQLPEARIHEKRYRSAMAEASNEGSHAFEPTEHLEAADSVLQYSPAPTREAWDQHGEAK